MPISVKKQQVPSNTRTRQCYIAVTMPGLRDGFGRQVGSFGELVARIRHELIIRHHINRRHGQCLGSIKNGGITGFRSGIFRKFRIVNDKYAAHTKSSGIDGTHG